MIAKLRGLLDSTGEDWCVIDVNGVGYLVFCSGRTLNHLSTMGETVSLMIDTHVREDHIHLYGFVSELERDWFRLLQTVQGVGAKVALAILSVAGPDELTQSIAAQDKTTVARASGVGPKVATRIVNELKDKVAKFAMAPVQLGAKGDGAAATASSPETAGEIQDAVSALVHLGYKQADAYVAVSTVARQLGEEADVKKLIRLGLKELSQ
ncbi:Holliday junction branch migration protein RuvA [Emcibacter nanhaiensis]|uniref:Holliday junction branch migration complex subunit RuvA n=1 Tax=Emcibacter nanhaiensis TaxID=1505037 RepID=A0A501PPE8_9PROT|nr:Holliday junction branch migration protein RuvA [Emcibacter nanhaiensis]TPD61972.1 Holliday junction branch migration protein RuvA [Emcibacter nanhaiensis]